jgi:hypothetical protein
MSQRAEAWRVAEITEISSAPWNGRADGAFGVGQCTSAVEYLVTNLTDVREEQPSCSAHPFDEGVRYARCVVPAETLTDVVGAVVDDRLGRALRGFAEAQRRIAASIGGTVAAPPHDAVAEPASKRPPHPTSERGPPATRRHRPDQTRVWHQSARRERERTALGA